MTSIAATALSRRRALAYIGHALGTAFLGAGAAQAAYAYTFPRIEVRGDRDRLGWTSAHVTISVTAPDSRAVQALERMSRNIEDRVKRLLSVQDGSAMLDQYRQLALSDEIEDIVLRVAPRGAIRQITEVSMLVYP